MILMFLLDVIHEDLLNILPLKYEDDPNLTSALVKAEVPDPLLNDNHELFYGDIHDGNEDQIIELETKIEHCEVEPDFSLCDLSTEYFCKLCEQYFETEDDLDVHKRHCFSKGEC